MSAPQPPIRMIHLGFGAFHRAHQAWVVDRANRAHPDDAWGIWAFTGRHPAEAQKFERQHRVFRVRCTAPSGIVHDTEVRSVVRVNDSGEVEQWCRAFREPLLEVVTVTVTEAGYCLGPDGAFDPSLPQIAADAAALAAWADGVRTPLASAPGKLVAGLWEHWSAKPQLPITVLSCDNLPQNGTLLADAVRSLAGHLPRAFTEWLADRVAFPSTVVDRIAPRLSQEAIDEGAEPLDVHTEQYWEWVIEDAFPAERPVWTRQGATLVPDIRPYQQRKLGQLNAAHSLLAYTGLLRSHASIAEAIGDPRLRELVEVLWQESQDASGLPEAELRRYRRLLLSRFENPGIRHGLLQIAADGSRKIPARLGPVLLRHRRTGSLPAAACTAIAAWLACLRRGMAVTEPDTALLGLVQTDPAAAVIEICGRIDPSLGEDAELHSELLRRYETEKEEHL